MILETYEIDGNRLRDLFPYPYKARPILTILPIIFLFNDEVAAEWIFLNGYNFKYFLNLCSCL